ncbi:Hypothetical protein FKW44_022947, partial [Caligus rogercresseyi]
NGLFQKVHETDCDSLAWITVNGAHGVHILRRGGIFQSLIAMNGPLNNSFFK